MKKPWARENLHVYLAKKKKKKRENLHVSGCGITLIPNTIGSGFP